MRAPIEVFGTPSCSYCNKAKALLTNLGVEFTYIDITLSDRALSEFSTRTGGATTVPQVFVKGEMIGGYTDLAELARTGAFQQITGGH